MTCSSEPVSEGLFNALDKMHSKERIAITGTLGCDISFIRKIPIGDSYKIRVTNRPIQFGEAWVNGRSNDYNFSAVELEVREDKYKSTGILLPACRFKIDKKTNELEVEIYQNPWTLPEHNRPEAMISASSRRDPQE